VDDTLKRLLTVESEASRLVEEARRKRERTIQQARDKAYRVESGYDKLGADIHHSHLEKSRSRARQAVEDLERRYDLRSRELHLAAKQHEEQAVQKALEILSGSGRG
jgi:hypothetical protein